MKTLKFSSNKVLILSETGGMLNNKTISIVDNETNSMIKLNSFDVVEAIKIGIKEGFVDRDDISDIDNMIQEIKESEKIRKLKERLERMVQEVKLSEPAEETCICLPEQNISDIKRNAVKLLQATGTKKEMVWFSRGRRRASFELKGDILNENNIQVTFYSRIFKDRKHKSYKVSLEVAGESIFSVQAKTTNVEDAIEKAIEKAGLDINLLDINKQTWAFNKLKIEKE